MLDVATESNKQTTSRLPASMEIRINHPIRLATDDVHDMLHSRGYGQTV